MMEMKRMEAVLRRLLSLVLVLSLLLPNFTGVTFATDYDPDEDTVCGIPAHTHTEDCDETKTDTVCGKEAGEVHTHIETCYEEKQVQVCTLDEVEAHSHTEECIVQIRKLTCGSEESEGHTHNEDCMTQTETLNCELEEAEGHSHADECYREEKTLSCGLDEGDEHTHEDTCYTAEDVLDCALEESEGHTHEDTCYTTEDVLDCGLEESEGHQHTDACYTLEDTVDCGLEETEGHAHGEACFELQTSVICGLDDTTPHEHTEECLEVTTQRVCGLEEHTHDEDCYDLPDIAMYNDVSGTVLLSSYTKPLTVYNYLYASNADGSGHIMSKDNKFTLTGTGSDSITVVSGGDASLTDENTRPMSHDIAIVLDEAEIKGDVTLKPATPNDADGYKTVITVTNASSLSDVELTEDALVVIDLEADLTLGDVTLGKDTKLTVNTAGHKLTLGSVTGSGDLTVTGSGSISADSISCINLAVEDASVSASGDIRADVLSLDSAGISASGNAITASDSISAVSSSISNASLFGFDSSAEGTVSISFTGATFTDVTRIGAADGCTALVRLDGDSSVTAEVNVSHAYDYTVSYADVTPESDWISSYRVKADSFDGDYVLLTENTVLPEYAEAGYIYLGWLTAPDAETPIKNIGELTAFGDLTLYSKTEANMVSVTMDLGFLPHDGNCDDADTWSENYPTDLNTNTGVRTVTQQLGTELALDTPQQFGYVFKGWKVKGSDITLTESTYTIVLDELTDQENYKLELEAVWQSAQMHLYWTFSAANVDFDDIEISMDGGNTWTTPTELAAENSSIWYMDSLTMKTYDAGRIQYGESLSAYFKRLNSDWQYPILRDKRSLSTDQSVIDTAQSFRTWAYDVQPVSGSTTFDTDANTGLLKKDSGQTWAEYQVSLNTTTISLQPSFGTMNYDLTIPTVSGWTYSVNGKDTEPTDGVIQVPNGATVAVKCSYANRLSISKWAFTVQNGSVLEIAERYTSADTSTIYYEFTMPASNVTAVYNQTVTDYVNIAKSPITFDEEFVYNGITRSGFWYDARMTAGTSANYGISLAGMTPLCYDADNGYFYIWDFDDTFYVTSDGEPTTNQLTLVKGGDVKFKAVNLSAREAYLSNAVGRTLYGYAVEMPRDSDAAGSRASIANKVNAKGSLAELGNIVLVGSGSDAQTFDFIFEGSNVVGAIFSDKLYVASGVNNTLNISGSGKASTSLMLGTAFANCLFSVTNIAVNEYSGVKSDYIFHASAPSGTFSTSNVTINAPAQEIYVADSSLSLSSYSSVVIETLVAGNALGLGTGTDVHVLGNVYSGYNTTSLGKNSRLIIEGDFLRNYFHWSSKPSTGASGAVMIVKGNRCELGNTTWTNGTLICNALVLGRCGGVSGGTVIANQIMNAPINNWDINSGATEYSLDEDLYQLRAVTANGDDYPFATYSQYRDTVDTFKFSGGRVYLLGYYKANGGTYDTSVVLKDTPVWALVSPMLNASGTYNGTAVSTANALAAVKNSSYTSNECVILGNSTYNTDARSRSIEFSGTAKVYAAGNLTFFNDTTVSGSAVVWCGGTFGTKNDMTVTGGSITADEVGIAYDLTTTLSDNTVRWKKLTVSGGSITADRVGTLSMCVSDNIHAIRGAADIDPAYLSDSTLEFDSYVNYLLGTTGFTNPAENAEKNSVHITATVTDHVAAYTAAAVTFAPPTFEGEDGTWKLTSVDGPIVDGVGTSANLTNGTETLAETAYDDDRLILLASKENYSLKVIAGADYVTDLNGQGSVDIASGRALNTVTVTLNDAVLAADKTVVWYTDANGYVRRPEDYTVTDSTVSFTMPYFDVEIYVVPDGMELDLSKYHVTVTFDGFRTIFDDPDAATSDREFRYTGNLKITQSLADKTPYRIRILADVNNLDASRSFTLSDIAQADTSADIGLLLENGAKAEFRIDGRVELCRVQVSENSDIVMEGVSSSSASDVLHVHTALTTATGSNTVALGNAFGKTGNISIKNVTLYCDNTGSNTYGQAFGYGTTMNSSAKVVYEDCVLTVARWYSGAYLAYNVGDVELNNCEFDISVQGSWPSSLFAKVDDVALNGTTMIIRDNSSTSTTATPVYYGVTDSFTVHNSVLTTTVRRSTSSTMYRLSASTKGNAPNMIISGSSVYTADERVNFKNITVKDSATLKVGAAGEGTLFAEKIEVYDNASVLADTILVSGYYTPASMTGSSSNPLSFDAVMAILSGSDPVLRDGTNGGLFIYGGSVSAHSVGGDLNSYVTVEGGTLTADRIGTLGAIYGYPEVTPVSGGEWICVYEKLPEGMSVIVANGTVNVGEYLGGINADISITGGTVVLEDGAVLGMTDEQSETLLAYCTANGIDIMEEDNIQVVISGGQVTGEAAGINAPYGDVIVSGETTGVKVENISALYGTVSISEANSAYTNPLDGQPNVGVYVTEMLTAQNLIITDNARVYAHDAIADAPTHTDVASLTVSDGAVLYTSTYGSAGQGSVSIVGKEGTDIILSTRQFAIAYSMRDDATDRATNHADNKFSFLYDREGKDAVTLYYPERHGYDFIGWYETEEKAEAAEAAGAATADEIKSIPTDYFDDVHIYAAWKHREVVFQIQIDGSNITDLATEMTHLAAGTADWDPDTKLVTFKATVSIPYLSKIFGDGVVDLNEFALPSYVIVDMKIKENDMGLDKTDASVTKQILALFDTQTDGMLTLTSTYIEKRNRPVTMDLNLDENDRPVGAQFQNSSAIKEGNTISTYAPIGSSLGNAEALVNSNGDLNQPAAPGYTFAGWYTDKACTGTPVDTDYVITGDNVVYFYADWTANEYKVTFDADEGVITAAKTEPTTEDTAETVDAYLVYDTVINGHLSYVSGEAQTNAMPYAWKPGYIFKGWKAEGSNVILTQQSLQEFNQTTFAGIDFTKDSVLTFTAVYDPITITYHTEKGSFTDEWLEESGTVAIRDSKGNITGWKSCTNDAVGYGSAMAGYTVNPAAAASDSHDLFGQQESGGRTYAVVATTAAAFASGNNTYHADDYRSDITRKGYTFHGWKDADGNFVGTMPIYSDIEVWAQWSANTYTVTLKEGKELHSTLVRDPDVDQIVTLKVGEEIAAGVSGVDITNWPDRDDWYAYTNYKSADEIQLSDHRYILGYTFDPLEPGAPGAQNTDYQTAYYIYANSVVTLINNDALFVKESSGTDGITEGSVFHLPERGDYSNDVISGTNEVPDYPEGSSFNMYAIYRERSLVFIERYIDTATGEVVEEVLEAPPYYQYSDYPDTYAVSQRKKDIEDKGYTLTKWSVNDYTTGDSYPVTEANREDIYSGKIEGWITAAEKKGSFDVNIYTVYSAQVTDQLTLEAAVQPSAVSAEPEVWPVPESMQLGTAVFTVTDIPEGLNPVSLEELEAGRYNSANTGDVALCLELVNASGDVGETHWLTDPVNGEITVRTGIAIGAEWDIRLTMYHSRVISEAETYTFKMKVTFPNVPNQEITFETVSVVLKPTLWTVRYNAALPEDEHLIIEDRKGFSNTGATRSQIVTNWVYGNALMAEELLPVLEGYQGEGTWSFGGSGFDYGANGTLALSDSHVSSALQLTTSYVPKEYTLTNSAAGVCDLSRSGITPYHTAFTLTPKDTDASFIWLRFDGGEYRLDRLLEDGYAEQFHASVTGGVYTVLMPAGDVEIVYDDVMDLYLDNGTIDLSEGSYTQNGETVLWNGNYRIWQDETNNTDFHSTENVLNINGDLTVWGDGSGTARTVELGRLNITSADSIALKSGCGAVMAATGDISAKNILVPENATLSLESSSTAKQSLTLAPNTGYAAIGGHNAPGGIISLDTLAMDLTMPAGSVASGIGSGNETGGAASVVVNNCTVNVTELATVADGAYRGTWFGGKNTGSVVITGTVVTSDANNAATVTDGDTVRITDSDFGTASDYIQNHKLRGENIWVDNSRLYFNANDTVLCPGNTLNVDQNKAGSVIDVIGYHETIYLNTLKIHDAAADVKVFNIQLADLSNGDITVDATGITQGGHTHEHTAGYRLLNSVDADTSADLTVNGLATNMYITTEASCKLSALTANADTRLRPLGLLPIANVLVNSGTFTVEDGTTAGISVTDSFGGAGNYAQNGGLLTAAVDAVIGGDMTLSGVTVNASGHDVGSSGTDRVTTVSITDSTVTADRIGAIGQQSESFTFVVLDGDSTLNGTLVQDHYRLEYMLEDQNFSYTADGVPVAEGTDTALPTVLRSSCVYTNGTAGAVTYLPGIPDAPKYTGEDESYFGNWYIQAQNDSRIALSQTEVEGFDANETLTDDHKTYAIDTAANDGTKTLQLYGWMKITATGIITDSRELNQMSGTAVTADIETDGAWTAQYTVDGVVLKDASYVFTFDSALPANTKLTLRFRNGDAQPVYYYCILSGSTTQVSEDDFCRMGTADEADLFSNEELGKRFRHTVQISADFADTAAVACESGLSLMAEGTEYALASVKNTADTAPLSGKVTVGASEVTVTADPGSDRRYADEHLYLVARIKKNNAETSLNYGAKLLWDGEEGIWIGGNMVYFDLGVCAALNKTAGWEASGLDSGTYSIEWSLTRGAADTQNVYGNRLSVSTSAQFTVTAAEPFLKVTSDPEAQVLPAGTAHTVDFTFYTEATGFYVSMEKQNDFQIFLKESGYPMEVSGESLQITLPKEAGVYRIRFSLDSMYASGSDWDDVYFTFILK